MSTPAKLSDKLYRWTKPNGGHDIGRIVWHAGASKLMRCEFGHLYWVATGDLQEHDTSYRQKEKEAEGANDCPGT